MMMINMHNVYHPLEKKNNNSAFSVVLQLALAGKYESWTPAP